MKRKWTIGFTVLACAALISGVALHSRVKNKHTDSVATYIPKTWSDFDEVKRLQMLIQGFAIESVVDVPSCDIEVFKGHDLGIKRYIGVTEDKDEAAVLQARFGSALRTFCNAEVTIDVLPKADLILCWDVLCTLTPHQAKAALVQFKKSGAKFLMMRHYPGIKQNKKNKTGIFMPVNWKLPPYNLPEPIIHIMEDKEHGVESLALWSMESL